MGYPPKAVSNIIHKPNPLQLPSEKAFILCFVVE
jgi:hypothetical protein